MTALSDALGRHQALAIAVSGGVDSMVLMHVAHQQPGLEVVALHAVSPAVPAEATARVRRHALHAGWRIELIEAGEMNDPDYLRNPVDRCFHCKKNLYGRIRAVTGLTIASGTNVDDLGDFRPGLRAAAAEGVVHPYVEAGVDKASIYALAAELDLSDLVELPAQPCLASRIETGIPVDARTLAFIEQAEAGLRVLLPGAGALRCRVTAAGVVVECGTLSDPSAQARVRPFMERICAGEGRRFAGLRPYRRGSAFLTGAAG